MQRSTAVRTNVPAMKQPYSKINVKRQATGMIDAFLYQNDNVSQIYNRSLPANLS